MDTTREALWQEIRDSRQAGERTNPRLERWYAEWDAWREQEGHGGIMSLPEAYALGVAAGVVEVERRYAALVEAARAVYQWGNADAVHDPPAPVDEVLAEINGDAIFDSLGAALASIDGAPQR